MKPPKEEAATLIMSADEKGTSFEAAVALRQLATLRFLQAIDEEVLGLRKDLQALSGGENDQPSS